MRVNPRLALLGVGAVVVVLSWASCGGATEGTVSPTGGQVCLPDDSVCIEVPIGGLETQEVLRITSTTEVPAGALSAGFDISSVTGKGIVFTKPATVRFSMDLADAGDLPNENLLRIYTLEPVNGGPDKDWQPLENAFVDRVRNVVTGETHHLSPFVLLRSDRLSDGGLPVELDGGARDAAVILPPPFDAGRPDAGRPDSGTPDAGTPDAGTPDAGGVDSGMPDAGSVDAGPVDSGTPDAGVDAGFDAGVADAGVDAGVDAGEDAGVDAGVDAGDPDAGSDAGVDDGGADAGDAG